MFAFFNLGGLELIFLVFPLALFGIWIFGLVEALTKEPRFEDRALWTAVVIILPVVGSGIYLVVRRPERIREHGK